MKTILNEKFHSSKRNIFKSRLDGLPTLLIMKLPRIKNDTKKKEMLTKKGNKIIENLGGFRANNISLKQHIL